MESTCTTEQGFTASLMPLPQSRWITVVVTRLPACNLYGTIDNNINALRYSAFNRALLLAYPVTMRKSLPPPLRLSFAFAFIGALALPAPVRAAGMDFSKDPVARTAEDALAGFEGRKQRIVALRAREPIGKFAGNAVQFTTQVNAKLAAGTDIEAVNRALLSPEAKVFAQSGSDFHGVPLCNRTGDYDFMLRGLIPLVFYHQARPDVLWPQTRRKLVYELLNLTGNAFTETVSFGICGERPETENHILMTEGTRYLTNQLRLADLRAAGKHDASLDNEANGMNGKMLRHLGKFLRTDFSEYNSKPYQAYTVQALQNLYEFADDARVKLAAELVLNYLDAKFAVSSNGLRRSVPFRRQKKYKDATELLQNDAESARLFVMAGPSEAFADLKRPGWVDFGTDRMLFAALGTYRTPAAILDAIVSPAPAPYFAAFRHTGIEIYSGSRSFLISGGGVWVKMWDWFTHLNSGWAQPTVLMPSRGKVDAKDLIRIAGHRIESSRANTCVSHGFACGVNVIVPDSIPRACLETQGHWTFANFASEPCPLRYGFYAAIYTDRCESGPCRAAGGNFGFFEAVEAMPGLDYGRFKAETLARNGSRAFRSQASNTYVNHYGQKVVFRPIPKDKDQWGIESVAGKTMPTDIRRWPLAQGNVVKADGSGLVTFENARLRKRVVLDMRDPLHPGRRIEDF